jgi:hyaluronan synthase
MVSPAGGDEATLAATTSDTVATRGINAFRWLLITGGVLIVLTIIMVKSTALWEDDTVTRMFLVYSVVVTCFQLSRLLAATFHERTMRDCYVAKADYEPFVSFVIPCMNEEKAIMHTISQCFAAHYPKHKFEVIVVNDGSTDGTYAVLEEARQRFPELTVVHWEQNRGKRHGMAEGFRLARGEIIIQLDSDSYIVPKTLRNLIEPFAKPDVGAVCAHADPTNADQNVLTKMQAAYYFLSFRILKAAESSFMTVFCCSGCSSAYRRSVVMPVLDEWVEERFLGKPVTWGDDRALTNRVLRAGYKTIYTDRAQAYTICPDNFRQLIKQQVRWKKGWLVNSIYAVPFVVRRYPFVAFTYFLPLIGLTLITPFIAARALVYEPIVNGTVPLYYLAGVFGMAALITVYYRYVRRDNPYWGYVFAWSTLNMIVLSFVLFYALVTVQNRRWSTR